MLVAQGPAQPPKSSNGCKIRCPFRCIRRPPGHVARHSSTSKRGQAFLLLNPAKLRKPRSIPACCTSRTLMHSPAHQLHRCIFAWLTAAAFALGASQQPFTGSTRTSKEKICPSRLQLREQQRQACLRALNISGIPHIHTRAHRHTHTHKHTHTHFGSARIDAAEDRPDKTTTDCSNHAASLEANCRNNNVFGVVWAGLCAGTQG